MGYKILGYFEFSMSLFLIFENNVQTLNILLLYLESRFSKIKKSDIENLKHLKFLYPIKFQYEEFNESENFKFGDGLIYFLS
jgi:hypothetical protein